MYSVVDNSMDNKDIDIKYPSRHTHVYTAGGKVHSASLHAYMKARTNTYYTPNAILVQVGTSSNPSNLSR